MFFGQFDLDQKIPDRLVHRRFWVSDALVYNILLAQSHGEPRGHALTRIGDVESDTPNA